MAIVIRQRKSGPHYQVRVRDPNGRWYRSPTFESVSDAKRYERTLLTQAKDKGQLVKPDIVRDMTFATYWQRWSLECRMSVSEGWQMTQNQMARDHLLPTLAKIRLLDMRPEQIGRLLSEMLENRFSSQTVLHIYTLLHKMFDDAIHHYEFLDKSPVLKRYRPQTMTIERDFLNPDAAQKLLEYCRNHSIGAAIWISMLSGLRPGEVQALRWKNVDLDRRVILIREAYKRKVNRIEPFPKQKNSGKAPIPDMLAEFLAGLACRTRGGEAFVAPGEGGDMLNYKVYFYGLKRLCKEAGVKVITPHELRHSCTELYVEQGASQEDLRRLLNQTSLTATKRYIHRTDERLSGIAKNVGSTLVSEPPVPKIPPRLHVVR